MQKDIDKQYKNSTKKNRPEYTKQEQQNRHSERRVAHQLTKIKHEKKTVVTLVDYMTFSLSHPFILPSIHAVHTYSTTSISQEEKHTSKERKILLSRVLPSNKRISSSKQTHTPGRQKRKNLLSLLEPNKETYWKPYYKENLLRKPNKYKSKDWILMVSSCENNS